MHVKANDDESSLHDNTPMPQGVNKMDACMDLALPISIGIYKGNYDRIINKEYRRIVENSSFYRVLPLDINFYSLTVLHFSSMILGKWNIKYCESYGYLEMPKAYF